MTDAAAELSSRFATAVERAAPAVVRVEGRRGRPSSGAVFAAEGLVVTAHHALEWDEGIEVTLADGSRVPAAVAGRDPTTDLALLRVRANGLSPLQWSSPEAVKVGHLALAVSRPGRSARATLGIVTATGGPWRTPGGGLVDRYLESDVRLHSGFSGSVLVETSGGALGVNTSAVFRGAAVAIPQATVRRVVDALAAHGRVRRGYLGVGTMPVRLGPEQAQALGLEAGLMLVSIQAGSPAHRAGLLMGDVLLAFDGHALTRPRDLLERLDEEAVGRTATLRVLRAAEVKDVAVTVGSRDRSES